MPTDLLTGSRYPDADGSSSLWTHFENAVKDLSDNTVTGPFASTAARDTAFASWVTAGGAMRAGLLASVTGSGTWVYNGSTWHPFRGIVGTPSVATTQWNGASGGVEQRITTLGLTGLALRSGTLYKARLKCRAWPSTAGNVFSLRVRASSTGTPTITSDAVATRQVGNPPGSTEASDYVVEDEFVVQSNGTFNVSAFGIIATGTMAVANDGRGRYELMVYDRGPAPTGMNTVTT